ncbi:MAG: RNA polymerase sigma factor [Phycisphaerales bacterium]|nr:RNA polymerase sigma factor [Phycisphaerales bacterium]
MPIKHGVLSVWSTDLESHDVKMLLDRAVAGDDQAWCDLVHAWAPRVHALLVSNCHDHDLAEEITQSTFCTVAAKLADYVDQGRFESWLFRIAMNRLRDEMRRRKRQAMPVESEVFTPLDRSGREDRARHEKIEEDVARDLWAAVADLSEADQQVLHLRHVAGLSFKQIADLLDHPTGTVLARHFRAIKRLRETLGDDFGADFLEGGA